jgi:hypothetical protein
VANNAVIRKNTVLGQPTEGALIALAMKVGGLRSTRETFLGPGAESELLAELKRKLGNCERKWPQGGGLRDTV